MTFEAPMPADFQEGLRKNGIGQFGQKASDTAISGQSQG